MVLMLPQLALSPPLNRWANTFTFSTEYSLSQTKIFVKKKNELKFVFTH